MFVNCCGRSKKNKETKSTKDAETQSDHEVLAVIENNVTVPSPAATKLKNCEVITDQPVEIDKRHSSKSVISDVKIEISDNDDDEVFCEGVGPPIKLAENLAAPRGKGKAFVQLPKWFSEEDDHEVGGVQEPPATPIGKDELALRRHRFFSELLNAAQNANEHKVHFDPFGPVIASNVPEPSSTEEFETLVSRLETVTTRLENVCAPITELLKLTSTCTTPDNNLEEEIVEDLTNMSFQNFQDIIDGHLAQYKSLSKYIGGPVEEQSRLVDEAFRVQLHILKTAHASKQPSQAELSNILQPLSQCIMKVQSIMEAKRGDNQFNHLAAIAESITALGWVAVAPTPAPYVKEMNDAGQFYTNRVLKEWKEKDTKHVEWVRAWIQTLTELQAFVKQHHTTGLVWSGKGGVPVSGAPIPPPPCCPPPPPPALCDLSITSDASTDRSALFAQLNQGENITRSLKKVTDDMQTHKNPTLRQGPAPFKSTSTGISQVKGAAVDKPPSFVRDGKKWLIEYQKGNQNLLVEDAEMNNVVYLFKCTESTVTVKGKINSITIDSCKKTSVVFDSLVSCVEFINCQSVQMQVLGKVPTISIDKTDGCQVYLSNDSLDVEIVSSKSSEMNILVPKPNGDYTEYPVPEQYKTTVVPGKGLSTIIVENKG